MAWIVGKVTEDELEQLRARGWEDVDPPQTMLAEDETVKDSTRAFFVDSDVFSIMSGPDWDIGGPEHKHTKATACLTCGVVHMPMPVKCGRSALVKCGCGTYIDLAIEN